LHHRPFAGDCGHMQAITLLALAGALAGLAGHYLLGRLRRGVIVHKGWTVVGVASLWALAGWRTVEGHLPWWWLPIPLTVAWFAVLLTVVDVKHRRLPNALTYSAYPVVAAATALATTQSGWQLAQGAVLGAAALGLLYLTMHVMSPSSMGAGDVKLSGSQGAVLGALGWPAVALGATAAAVLTLLLNAATPRRLRKRWKSGIPHGPGLLAATYALAMFPTHTTP
jgi:leader peptidase (prepilin peptidase) / N-methyltransferase